LIYVAFTNPRQGWVHIRGERTAYTNYYKKHKDEGEEWPPKFCKFQLITDSKPKVEVAFTDPRRFGRVRVVDCPGLDIRKHSPLKENGPDPVVDLDVFTEEYLRKKMRSKHVPIKALLLDQSNISGIGNWVADEVLYQSKLHPEQYSNEFSDEQIKSLYEAIRYVCQTSVDKLGDSDQFPKDWLFKYRWSKGDRGGAGTLPNGQKLAFIQVGGRTSCYAPAIQKKTGHVAPGIKEEPLDPSSPPAKTKAKKASRPAPKPEEDAEEPEPARKKKRTAKATTKVESEFFAKKEEAATPKKPDSGVQDGRRRSGRLRSLA
jgi:formamidopyrimidine-DNA glycosylase